MESMSKKLEYRSVGERWLDLMGLREYADLETSAVRDDGSVILFGEFNEIRECGPHVEGLFKMIESGVLCQDDIDMALNIARERALQYIDEKQLKP